MAKRKSSSRKRRNVSVIPAETTLKYILPGNGDDIYIDLMRDISAINRRAYNQGQILNVTGFTFKQDSAQNTKGLQATVKAAPISWVSAQAYMKARNAWFHQQKLVGSDYGHSAGGQERIRPKYEDFKIFLDNGQRTWALAEQTAGRLDADEFSQPTLTGDSSLAVVQGEWDFSKFVYADQSSPTAPEIIHEPYMHLVGPDVATTDVGLINAYEDSRSTVSPTVPNVPAAASTNIYALLSAGQDDGASMEVIENMEDDNDNPPYSLSNYAGGAVNYPNNVDKLYVQTNPSSPVVRCSGFPVFCGLLRIYSQGITLATGATTTQAGTLLVHVAPGPKKGVLSMNVGELV